MRILLSEAEIHNRVTELAEAIVSDYEDRPVTVLGILTGSLIFLADLIRRLDLTLQVGLLQASSYRGKATTPGELSWNADLIPDLSGKHVLLVDDILDTGHTLSAICGEIQTRNIASLKTCVLLWKTARTVVEIKPDYVGFEIPDEFVVGYGLDYDGHFRHLPYIAAMEDTDLGR